MADPNIDKALAYLGTSLNSLIESSKEPVDFKTIGQKIPRRSLTGDHITGGKITNFSSSGIVDQATKTKITINDESVEIYDLVVNNICSNTDIKGKLSATEINAEVIYAKKIVGDVEYGKNESIKFSGDKIYGQGLLWETTKGNKQLVLREGPDRFFFSESIELGKDKALVINGIDIINATSLGNSITKSNLKELGRLKGLLVDGDINIANHIFYNATASRLGIGTDEPKSLLTLSEDGIDLVLGTKDNSIAFVGTYSGQSLALGTDDTPRLTLSSGGNIMLGNPKQIPVQVGIHGKLAIKVNSPDPDVDLHVNGSIKYHGHQHRYGSAAPQDGTFNKGDIVWNDDPRVKSYVGWICVRSGNPGSWEPFGKIGNQ